MGAKVCPRMTPEQQPAPLSANRQRLCTPWRGVACSALLQGSAHHPVDHTQPAAASSPAIIHHAPPAIIHHAPPATHHIRACSSSATLTPPWARATWSRPCACRPARTCRSGWQSTRWTFTTPSGAAGVAAECALVRAHALRGGGWRRHATTRNHRVNGVDRPPQPMPQPRTAHHACMPPRTPPALVSNKRCSVLYSTLAEFCTERTCVVMSAGSKYEYLWADGVKYKKPVRLSAPEYVDKLFDWVEAQVCMCVCMCV